MSIRLIKVSKELNVGISSLVEFLDKKGVQVEANPNTKINDEHYEMLNIEFGKDKKIRKTVEKQREEQQNKEVKETVAIEGYEIPNEEQKRSEEIEERTPTTILSDKDKPQVTVVGSIDLDDLDAKPKLKQDEKKTEKKEQETVVSKPVEKVAEKPEKVEKKEIVVEKEAKLVEEKPKEKKVKTKSKPEAKKEKETTKTVAEEEKLPKEKEEAKKEIQIEKTQEKKELEKGIKAEEKKVSEKEEKIKKEEAPKAEKEEKVDKKTADTSDVAEEEEEDSNLFRLSDSRLETNIVVKGTIDLDSINEKTRPARKSRAQRKKERLEREGKASSKRIKDETIKELKKESINEKKRADDDADGTTKKKRRRIRKGKVNIEKGGEAPKETTRRRPVLRKPVKREISEEDVQKQIKETLARLTRKKSGGRGGARHRRDKREAVIQRQQAELKQQEKESRKG